MQCQRIVAVYSVLAANVHLQPASPCRRTCYDQLEHAGLVPRYSMPPRQNRHLQLSASSRLAFEQLGDFILILLFSSPALCPLLFDFWIPLPLSFPFLSRFSPWTHLPVAVSPPPG